MYQSLPKKYLGHAKYYNPNSEAPQHPARILICGASGSGKSNLALNLIREMGCFDKIYLYAKKLDEPLYLFLIDTYQKLGKKHNEFNCIF